MYIHIAAPVCRFFIQLRIQHLCRSFAAHIVQVDNTGHRHAGSGFRTHSHTGVGQHGRNGMGGRSIHRHAGFFFFPASRLQLAAGPGILGHRAVDHIAVFQACIRFNRITVAAFGHYLAVFDQRFRLAADFIAGARHADSGGSSLAKQGHVQQARVVGDGLVALSHHAHITRAVNARIFNFGRRVVGNEVMAAGTANSRRTLPGAGSAHSHAGNISFGSSVNIQIACIHRSGVLFICIRYASRGRIFNAVHTHGDDAGQERLVPAQLHGGRSRLQG